MPSKVAYRTNSRRSISRSTSCRLSVGSRGCSELSRMVGPPGAVVSALAARLSTPTLDRRDALRLRLGQLGCSVTPVPGRHGAMHCLRSLTDVLLLSNDEGPPW